MSDHYGSISINEANSPKKEVKPSFTKKSPPRKKRTGGYKGILFAVLSALLLGFYFASARYLAPMAIEKYLPGYIQKSTGLSFSMGEVEVNPLNFQLHFTDVTADTPDSKTRQPLLQIPSLFIDMDLTSLLRNSFACDKLTLQDPSLNIIRLKDKSYNLPVLSRLSQKQNQEEIIDFTNLPFLFSFNNIDINNGNILLTDQVRGTSHTVKKLYLAIPTLSNFSFQAKDYILPHFSAIINNSKVELNGKTISLEDGINFQTKLFCSIANLDLITYFSYLPDSFPWVLSKGTTDLNLEITFSPGQKQEELLAIDINVKGSDIFLQTKSEKTKISLPFIQLDATLLPISRRLDFKTIVAKKPQLISNQQQLSAGLSSALAPYTDKSKHIAITIGQLLLDQGRLVLQDKEDSIWNSLECSIRDFNMVKNSGNFRISGKQAIGSASFTWQGSVKQARTIQGKLIFNDFQANPIIRQLHQNQDLLVTGTTDFTGDLTLSTVKPDITEYSIDNATMQFHNLTLAENKTRWLQADSVRFTRLQRLENRFSLGNIFLKNSSLRLTADNYPTLFNSLFSTKNRPDIQGVDLTGELYFQPLEDQEQELHFTELRFQANRLDKKAPSENFNFAGTLGSNGQIKSKGILSLAPTALQADITFSAIDSALLSPFFKKWPILLHSDAMLHGKGTFNYPATSFQGKLRLTDGRLQLEENKSLLSWDNAELDKAECVFSPFSLKASQLTFQNPQMQYNIDTKSPFQRLESSLRQLLATNDKKESLFPVYIKKTNFGGATVPMKDQRITPPWKSTLNEVEGYINNLNSKGEGLTSFGMEGLVEGAPYSLSGSIALFQNRDDARARLSLSDFPLRSFAKQLKNQPLKIENAMINLQSKLTSKDLNQSSISEITISDLFPSSTEDDTALAVALLKNSAGNFRLSIEMKETNRALFQAATDNFQTNVIKSSYAPLLLDPNFKDLQNNSFILFQAGTNKLSAAGKETLIRYSALLAAHPTVALSITGQADEAIDRDALAKAITDGKAVTVYDDELLELAMERTLIVYDFCIHSLAIAPARVSINEKPLLLNTSPANGAALTLMPLAVAVAEAPK